MGTEENGLLHELGAQNSTALLDADSIPNENQSLTCFSCNERMTGLFCYACGNKNDNYRRSVWFLGVELFQSITAFEGRIWRSLLSLIVKPGQMAREFADGARQKWTSPIRLFLATSLLLFGYIALSNTQVIALGAVEMGGKKSAAAITSTDANGTPYQQRLLFFVRQSALLPLTPDQSLEKVNTFFRGFQGGLTDRQDPESVQRAIDDLTSQIESTQDQAAREALSATRDGLIQSLEDIAAKSAELDGTEVTEETSENTNADDPTRDSNEAPENEGSTINFNRAGSESISLNREGITEIYSRILRNPEIINNQLNSKLKLAMFFMMPFAMFMGAIFIRGRDTAMLFDHLVHAAYVHAFSFLLLFVFILLTQFTTVPYLLGIYTLILMIYLPISAKNMFRRGWFKSVLTAYGVGSVYTFIIAFVAILIVANSLYSIAADVSQSQARAAQSQDISVTSAEAPGI